MPGAFDPPRFRSHTARGVVAAVVAIDLIVSAAAWSSALDARRSAFAHAERTAQNLARVLAQNLEGTIRLVDFALAEARSEILAARAGDDRAAPQVAAILSRFHDELGFLAGIRTADRDGHVEPGAGVPAGMTYDVSDRDYFLSARERAGARLIVSAPLVSRITGERSLTIARRLERPDGAFDGIVYAVIALKQLTATLASVDSGPDGAVVLRGADNAVVARFPERQDLGRVIGHRTISPQLEAVLASGTQETTFVATSPIDGQEKVTAFRRVGDGPFYLLVAASSKAALEGWRRDVRRTAVAVCLFVVLTALAAWFLLRSWRRESEASFRSLVEGAPIAVAAARGAEVVYVNPAFVKAFGLANAAVATGRSIVDSVPAADAGRLAERIERRMRGEAVEPTMEVTLLRPDGTSFLAAVTDATVDLSDGPTIVGFIQDITHRKQSEAERERLIGELKAALADVKTLRGLLPICAHCKKIRDDRGYWNRIETFIRERSDAEFTHGICPDCAKQYFPDDEDEGAR